MREILFRGKRLDNGEWAEGNLVFAENKAYIVIDAETMSMDNESTDLYAIEWYEVDKETIGQFTRFFDKNEVKIFEGDLIRISRCNDVHSVRFILGAFGLTHAEVFKPFSSYLLKGVLFEVIGNIHDKAV